MKQKPVYQIVQLAEDELTPKADVRVSSQRHQQIYPAVNLMLPEGDKYQKVDIETYQAVYELAYGWDTFDMAQFTLQWPNGETVSITRGFLEDCPEMPLVESVVKTSGEESEGQIYVRLDTLATYETYQKAKRRQSPNVKSTKEFLYNLFMHQDLDWCGVLNFYGGNRNLETIMLTKTFKGVENYVRSPTTRAQVKFITSQYLPDHKVASMKDSAAIAVQCALGSLVETIAHQVYGSKSDDSIENVLNADVHFTSLGLVTEQNEHQLDEELVYTFIKDNQLYLTFGSLDQDDGINDLRTEFDLTDEEVTADTIKIVKFIYPNLV